MPMPAATASSTTGLFNGVASKLETDRATAALANAAAAIPQLEIQIATTEDQLNVLLGRHPGPIIRNSLP